VEGRGVAADKRVARDLGAYVCFQDEAGQGLRPPKGRTWALGTRSQTREAATPAVLSLGARRILAMPSCRQLQCPLRIFSKRLIPPHYASIVVFPQGQSIGAVNLSLDICDHLIR
jgi:hypothetical protein